MNRLFSTLLTVALFACSGIEDWPRERFSSAAWLQSPADQRYRFATDLRDSRVLAKKSTGDVLHLLGEPDSKSADGAMFSYLLRTDGSGFDQVFTLDVTFGPDQMVEEVRIRGD